MNELTRLRVICGVQDWWRDHGATVAAWLLALSIASLLVPVWLGKASSDDAASVGRKLDRSNTEQVCRSEYSAVVTGARTLLDDAGARQDGLVNSLLRAYIAEDLDALRRLVPELKAVAVEIASANRDALTANGLYQNLLRAQRTDPVLFAAMCKTGPPPS